MTESSPKSNAWRPTKIDDEIVWKLVDAFKNDSSVEEACSYAGIVRDTYYRRYKKYKRFSDKIDDAKQFPFILSKSKIFSAVKSNDLALSAKYALEFLKRRHPDRKDKQENTVNWVGFTSIIITDATKPKKPGSSTNGKTEGTTE